MTDGHNVFPPSTHEIRVDESFSWMELCLCLLWTALQPSRADMGASTVRSRIMMLFYERVGRILAEERLYLSY